ncbi:MAG: zinc-dependent peptidase [Xenococcaceae cyanobacterium MO_167.B27]|nr:zinc-dependent peptidase [Xenococcaceae cyanobacterium MO_167.B27]
MKKRVLIKVVIFGLTLMVIIALIWLVPALIKLRRQAIKEKPFPLHWEAIIKQNLIFYKHFPPSLRKRLQGHVNVILAEKQFVGCGGLQITEEIKLTIAAISARAAVE